jgi:hypothetical protein
VVFHDRHYRPIPDTIKKLIRGGPRTFERKKEVKRRVRDLHVEELAVFLFWRDKPKVYIRTDRRLPLSDSLNALEQQRADILTRILQLGDFRSGSITSIQRRCEKSSCRCHQPGQPGHGPNFRLRSSR